MATKLAVSPRGTEVSEPRADRHPRHQQPPVTTQPRPGNGADQGERQWRSGLTPVSLVLALLVAYFLLQVQLLLILVILAIIFATLIERPVELLQDRHIPRPLSILLMYVAIIAGLGLFFVGVAPAIREQSVIFRDQAPGQIQELQESWSASANPILNGVGQDALVRVIQFLDEPGTELAIPEGTADMVITLATGVGGGVIGLLTTLVIAFYYLMEKDWLRQIILDQVKPGSRRRVSHILDNVETKVGDWMRGQLVLMLAIGVVATIGYGILGVRFWPLLGIWAGLTELIPIVGPWLGGIPAVIIALTQGWDKALIVIGFIVLIQSFENYILVPRVMRGAVGLTPMTVFLAILAGTQFLGIMGAVLAIPVAAAVQVVLSDYFRSRREDYLAESPSAVTSWQWMRGQRVIAPDGTEMAVVVDEPPPSHREQRTSHPPEKRRTWSRNVLSRPAKADDAEE